MMLYCIYIYNIYIHTHIYIYIYKVTSLLSVVVQVHVSRQRVRDPPQQSEKAPARHPKHKINTAEALDREALETLRRPTAKRRRPTTAKPPKP